MFEAQASDRQTHGLCGVRGKLGVKTKNLLPRPLRARACNWAGTLWLAPPLRG